MDETIEHSHEMQDLHNEAINTVYRFIAIDTSHIIGPDALFHLGLYFAGVQGLIRKSSEGRYGNKRNL